VIAVTVVRTRERRPEHRSIADPFLDLLEPLDDGARRGLVHRLAVGYYEGWHPTRHEVALLVDLELGRITEAEYLDLLRSSVMPPGQQEPAPDGVDTHPGNDPTQAADRVGNTAEPDHATQCPPQSFLPRDLQAFRVDCGTLAPPFRFVMRGLAHGRSEEQDRLVSLYYELLPPSEPLSEPTFFTAPILCMPTMRPSHTAGFSQTTSHAVGPDSVIGHRGPWILPPSVRQLKFLIYPQSPEGSPHRHPAGALHVDVECGEAEWLPVNGRRAARAARKAHRSP
jgi:hypothetical protein